MPDAVNADMSAVAALAADLGGVSARVVPQMRSVTSRGALNIKNAAKASIQSQTRHKYVVQYPNSITYDITAAGLSVSAEIGPDKGKPQGALGNLLEFGSSRNAPLPHLIPSWEAEVPGYESFMAAVAEASVFGS